MDQSTVYDRDVAYYTNELEVWAGDTTYLRCTDVWL